MTNQQIIETLLPLDKQELRAELTKYECVREAIGSGPYICMTQNLDGQWLYTGSLAALAFELKGEVVKQGDDGEELWVDITAEVTRKCPEFDPQMMSRRWWWVCHAQPRHLIIAAIAALEGDQE